MSQENKRSETPYNAKNDKPIMQPTFKLEFLCSNCKSPLVITPTFQNAAQVTITGRFLLSLLWSYTKCDICGVQDYPNLVISMPLFDATSLIDQYHKDAQALGMSFEDYVTPVEDTGIANA